MNKKYDRTGWARTGVTKPYGRGRKQQIEFSRYCAKCGVPFSIFVTERIASGEAGTNSFGLRTCTEHRRGKNNSEKLPWEA